MFFRSPVVRTTKYLSAPEADVRRKGRSAKTEAQQRQRSVRSVNQDHRCPNTKYSESLATTNARPLAGQVFLATDSTSGLAAADHLIAGAYPEWQWPTRTHARHRHAPQLSRERHLLKPL